MGEKKACHIEQCFLDEISPIQSLESSLGLENYGIERIWCERVNLMDSWAISVGEKS